MSLTASQTPLEKFIDHKTNTGMQCGNYTIDLPPLKEGEQYRFHFDATACVGCRCCEVACNEQNANPDEIKWRRVGEMEAGSFPDTLQLFNSMSCNHCLEPECLIGCPTESYIKLENGIVWHDDPSCIGCQYCTWNCPYEVPTFNPDRGIVTKCHMCADKLEAGQSPACVQACPSNAIQIEAFDVKLWEEEQMATQGVAPLLPDVSITKPATRYTLPDLPPEASFRPADAHILKPAHPEWPLVFMTLLTQAGVGASLALFLGEVLWSLGLNLPKPDTWGAFLPFFLSAIGLPLSALHLGRPAMAYKAFKNYKTSWLSREAIALGAFTALAGLVWILYLAGVSGGGVVALEALTVGIGIYGIYAQIKIYRIKARPSWDRMWTNRQFFASFYLGWLSFALLLSSKGHFQAVSALLSPVLLFAVWQLFTAFEVRTFYRNLDASDPLYRTHLKSAQLWERFDHINKLRFITLGIFGVAMVLTAIVTASAQSNATTPILALAVIGAFFSEILGRYLFYTTTASIGTAGHFFMGNQR